MPRNKSFGTTKKSFHTAFLSLSALAALWLAPQAGATTIYSDAFPGLSTSSLNGTTPATESGTLGGSASTAWNGPSGTTVAANGSVNAPSGASSAASAALPFTPQSGNIYTLSATLNDTGVSGSWFALGFEQSEADLGAFVTNNGQPWTLLEAARGTNEGSYIEGPATNNATTFDEPTGAVNLQIVLNTTAASWTEQFWVNGTDVSGTLTPGSNPTIAYVALAENTGGVATTGTFQNFSLIATPEPSTWLSIVGGLGMLVGFRRRRTA